MNVREKWRHVGVGALLAALATMAMAEQGSGSRAQAKVSIVKARMWQGADGKNPMESTKEVVNNGSKRAGTCTLDIGTAESGNKAPKEIVVVAQTIINNCK